MFVHHLSCGHQMLHCLQTHVLGIGQLLPEFACFMISDTAKSYDHASCKSTNICTEQVSPSPMHACCLTEALPLQLTDVKAMLGCTGQTRFLLGCISQLQDGAFHLEDMTGSLQLDLSDCQTSSGLYTGDSAGLHIRIRTAHIPVCKNSTHSSV